MNKFSLVFIIALVAIAKANDTTMFAEVEQDEFGATLMDLVQINMQSNLQSEMKSEDSLDSISNLLAQINGDLTAAKKAADAHHVDFQARAARDILAYQNFLAAQRARLAAVRRQLRADRNARRVARASLRANKAHLAQVLAQIAAADKANVIAVAAFQRRVRETVQAIRACRAAVVELSKLNHGNFAEGTQVNLVEVKSHMSLVEKTLNTHLPSSITLFKPILQAFADLSTNADPALVAKIVKFINQLRAALENDLAATRKAEKVRVANYVQLRKDLVSDQLRTQALIGRLRAQIRQLSANIRVNRAIKAQLIASIALNEKLLALRVQQRDRENAFYNKQNAIRVRELSIIQRLRDFFEARFQKGFSQYLRKRVARL